MALAALVRLVRQAVVITLFVDPVCGMKVDAAHAYRLEHGGETYYFCAPACREAFARDPGRYLTVRRSRPLVSPFRASAAAPRKDAGPAAPGSHQRVRAVRRETR